MRFLDKIIPNKTRVFLELSILAWIIGSFVPPMSFWYELYEVEPAETVYEMGDTVYLNIARDVKLPFYGTWAVDLYRRNPSGKFSHNCTAFVANPKLYNPDSELYLEYDESQNLLGTPLWWWADGDGDNDCDGRELDPGVYHIRTCHEVHLYVLRNRKNCVDSHSFKIQYRLTTK